MANEGGMFMHKLAAVTGIMLLLSVSACFAGSGGNGGAGGNGGSQNGQPGGEGLAGKNGQRGMDGCPGGTARSADGHYYLPGTHERCHPPSTRKQHRHKQMGVESV